jgi:hypothetical protein
MTYFEQLEKHLLDEILVFANLVQIPAVILTGASPGLFADRYDAGLQPGSSGFPSIIISIGLCITGRG